MATLAHHICTSLMRDVHACVRVMATLRITFAITFIDAYTTFVFFSLLTFEITALCSVDCVVTVWHERHNGAV